LSQVDGFPEEATSEKAQIKKLLLGPDGFGARGELLGRAVGNYPPVN